MNHTCWIVNFGAYRSGRILHHFSVLNKQYNTADHTMSGLKVPWRKDRLPTPVFLGFPCGSAGKESSCNVGDLGSIPGLERSPGEGKGDSLQYSGLENPTDHVIVHGVAKSRTQLSDFHFSCLMWWP